MSDGRASADGVESIEVHWQHPRHQLENPVLLVMPHPTREQWAVEVLDDQSAVVVCRRVLWKDSDGEIRKHAERVDPLDEIPGYIEEALLNYDLNYGPVEDIVNPVNDEDYDPPEDPLMTLDDYFVEGEETAVDIGRSGDAT
jgi:hypothetical protein